MPCLKRALNFLCLWWRSSLKTIVWTQSTDLKWSLQPREAIPSFQRSRLLTSMAAQSLWYIMFKIQTLLSSFSTRFFSRLKKSISSSHPQYGPLTARSENTRSKGSRLMEFLSLITSVVPRVAIKNLTAQSYHSIFSWQGTLFLSELELKLVRYLRLSAAR